MESNPKISFVIPAYNAASTISESVESLFAGNFTEGDEVIIVNDCSTDETSKAVDDLQKRYPQIKVINNGENLGCPASRNVGVRAAANELIFNLDADNVLVPGSVAYLRNYLISENADIAAFSEFHFFVKDIHKVTHKWMCKTGVISLADFLAGPISPGPDGNFLYTKASWEKIGGYWEYGKGLHEAWGFTLKQLGNGAKFVALPNSHLFHRYGHESLFVRESKVYEDSSLMATRMIMNFIDLVDDEDAAYIKSEYGSRNWFSDLSNKKPIRLKSGEKGQSGYLSQGLGNRMKNLYLSVKRLLG